MNDAATAEQIYELELYPASRIVAAVVSLGLVGAAALGIGGDFTFGRRRADVYDKRTDELLASFTEPLVVGSNGGDFGEMLEAFEHDTASEFERKWLA